MESKANVSCKSIAALMKTISASIPQRQLPPVSSMICAQLIAFSVLTGMRLTLSYLAKSWRMRTTAR